MDRSALCRVACLFGLLLAAGCEAPVADQAAGEVGENLSVLANAYQQATEKNNQPPQSAEDLKPFLPADADPNKLLVSVRDGQPFVIVWGADPRTGMDLKPMVIGYEKNGKGGTRMVYTAMGVMTMADADFAEANFPPGHKPAP